LGFALSQGERANPNRAGKPASTGAGKTDLPVAHESRLGIVSGSEGGDGVTEVTKGHTVRKYDKELGNARRLVLEMGAQVLEQVRKAVSALVGEGDIGLAREVVDNERKIDARELDIDEAIFDLIAKRQPAAIDLRFILALSKVAGNLERAGDKAAQIAWCAIRLMGRTSRRPASKKILHHIHSLDQVARRLLERSLDALAKVDVELALDVFEDGSQLGGLVGLQSNGETADSQEMLGEGSELDDGFDAAIRHAMTFVFEDTQLVGQVLDVVFVLRALASIGDHAGNIAEQVIFVAKGKDVRYQNKEVLVDALRERK